ncbi:hypothetical protein [Cellulomonas marina]|uniref:hypothetical protein n=1 Tax=Cellulomonas marina TaxID=988821 RepID=UPI000B7CD91D|nr:hypothetical protein [Cellulomonas marina]
MAIALTLLLVLLVAALVLVGVSAVLPDDEGHRPWTGLREGWAARRAARSGHDADAAGTPGTGADAASAGDRELVLADPVDVSLAELLRSTVERGDAYVRVDELATGLQRVTERAQERTSGLLQHVRRG